MEPKQAAQVSGKLKVVISDGDQVILDTEINVDANSISGRRSMLTPVGWGAWMQMCCRAARVEDAAGALDE